MFTSGVIVYDYELKIGWGKSVALPSQALPAPPPGQMAIRNKEVTFFVLSCCIKICVHLTSFVFS
jgi:U2-associated protein SR140